MSLSNDSRGPVKSAREIALVERIRRHDEEDGKAGSSCVRHRQEIIYLTSAKKVRTKTLRSHDVTLAFGQTKGT